MAQKSSAASTSGAKDPAEPAESAGTAVPAESAETDGPPEPALSSFAELAVRLSSDGASLAREIGEVDLLITQARSEAARHETRRAAAADKLAAATGAGSTEPKALADLNTQLITFTKRAALMESQVDVLEGKRRALTRYRESLEAYARAAEALLAAGAPAEAPVATTPVNAPAAAARTATPEEAGGEAPTDAPMSRIVLAAQEDLRREIARAMHDGPAQSLTNIVLQAQIVERLVGRDLAMAQGEVHQLIAMVQQTLDATKSFIFDVRPMVLDDLGLVPTLRRAARERGRRAGIPVDFESLGADRRLPMDLESGFFRILDEALTAYLSERPDRLSLRIDWGDQLEARLVATRETAGAAGGGEAEAAQPERAARDDMPPALAAMIEDRRTDARNAAEAARRDAIVALPPGTWREIETRATTMGLIAELLADGAELRIVAELPSPDGTATT